MKSVLLFSLIGIIFLAGCTTYQTQSYQQPTPTSTQTQTPTPTQTSSPTPTSTQSPSSNQVIKSFTIHESNFKFDLSKITVNKGDTVQITVVNDGGTHNVAFPDFNARTTVNSGGTQTITFTADKTGTFQYYCEVDGHAGFGMTGTLTVQ